MQLSHENQNQLHNWCELENSLFKAEALLMVMLETPNLATITHSALHSYLFAIFDYIKFSNALIEKLR